MDNAELARLVVNDWPAAGPIVQGMPSEERDSLCEGIIEEFFSQHPTSDRAQGIAEFMKTLHLDPRLVEDEWRRGTIHSPPAPVHGTFPVYIWNRIASESLEHACLLHKHAVEYLMDLLSQAGVCPSRV